MSSILNQLSNSVTYAVHKATYNPEAEAFAKKQAKDSIANAEKEKQEIASIEKAKQEALQKAADEEAVVKEAKLQAERESFDGGRLMQRIGSTVGKIFGIFVLLSIGILGASLATNLNIYRSTVFRILYAIYGFLFCLLVIPYVLLYRWWWQGKKPRFYALIPIIPYHLDNPMAALMFSWLSYKPDCEINTLKEWEYA